MKKRNRLLALALALLMLLGLCACGNNNGGGSGGNDGGNNAGNGGSSQSGNDSGKTEIKGVDKVRLEHVYTADYLDAKLGENSWVNNTFSVGSDLYFLMNYNEEIPQEDGSIYYTGGMRLSRLSADGSALETVREFPYENDYDDENQISTYSNVYNVAVAADGSIWYFREGGFSDWSDPENYVYENFSKLIHESADGTVLCEIDTAEYSEDGWFYAQYIFPQADGGLHIIDGSNRYLQLDAQGQLLKSQPLSQEENSWFNGLCRTGSGTLVGLMYVYDPITYENKNRIVRIDPASGEFIEVGDVPLPNAYQMSAGPGDTVLMNASSTLYSYDINTGELKEMLNWLNSDMNYNYIQNYTALEDGRLLVTEYNRDYRGSSLVMMSPADEVVEKYVIRFAAMWLDDNLQDAIIRFNKQNEDFRIQFVDYSVHNNSENWNAGVEKLNLDIISGNIPDLFSMEGLNLENYASKGLLADLGKWMDKDTGFDRAAFLPNILEASSIGGKTYSVIPAFSLITMAAKSSLVGTEPGWTMADMNALLQQHPEARPFPATTTRGELLGYMLNLCMGSYVDAESGQCYFNGEEFVRFLEFLKLFPEEIDWDEYYGDSGPAFWEEEENQYRNNKTLFGVQYLYSYEDMKSIEYNFGEEVTFIGFPVPEGVGAAFSPQMEVAMSARTKLGDACWDFLKYLLSEEYQEQITWTFPVRLDRLAELREEAMTATNEDYYGGIGIMPAPLAVLEAAGEVIVTEVTTETEDAEATDETTGESADEIVEDDIAAEEPATPGDMEQWDNYWAKPVTQAQADKVDQALQSTSSISRQQTELQKIIEEEAAAFFAGQKSAQAVADIIQSRAQIYISENR